MCSGDALCPMPMPALSELVSDVPPVSVVASPSWLPAAAGAAAVCFASEADAAGFDAGLEGYRERSDGDAKVQVSLQEPAPAKSQPADSQSDPLVPLQSRETPAVSVGQGGRTDLDPAKCVILVPAAYHVKPACDERLRRLERRGYTVRRVGGYAAIDQGRNQIATNALLRDGFAELMWIDADIVFEPEAVDRLRSHGLPISCGVYAKKGRRAFACNFPPGTKEIRFGSRGGLIEIPYAGAGFLHTRRRIDPEATTQPSSGMTLQTGPGAEPSGDAAGRL